MPTKNVINLLPESAVAGSRRLSIFKTLQAVLIVVVMACLIMTLGIWAISLIAGREIEAENLKSKTLEEQIQAYSKKEQQFYLLAHQLDKADELFNSRVSMEKKLNDAIAVFPAEAVLTSAKIEGTGREISIKYIANNFDVMAKVIAVAKTKPFSLVRINGFTRELSGQYFIDLTVQLL
jgi:Tfp pilus assembly protein PilN